MSSTSAVLTDRIASLRPSVVVAVGLPGVSLPVRGGRGALDLGPAELLVLEALARETQPVAILCATVAEQVGVPVDRLTTLVGELDARDLLVDDAIAHSAPGSVEVSDAVAPNGPAPRPDDETELLVMATPTVFRLSGQGFDQVDHDGEVRVRMTAVELAAAAEFRRPFTRAAALDAHRIAAGAAAIDGRDHAALVARLDATGLVARFDPDDPVQQHLAASGSRELRESIMRHRALLGAIDTDLAERDRIEAERFERTGTTRTRVVPVHFDWRTPPLSLGLVMAYAKAYEDGRLDDHYDFRPDWITDAQRVSWCADQPAVWLFSHYLWNCDKNLEISARVKALNPANITIHGGPDVPKYDADLDGYFRAHPHVDVTIKGEGEITAAEALAALVPVLAGEAEISVLAGVPGLAFRDGDRIVRTGDRDRIVDLDILPSPYLTGLFDCFAKESRHAAIIETNRGCPYGCTFCDWGSATASRIRKFSLERVFAELEWCAEHGINTASIADANFGIFERDVEIAQKVADLKLAHGYPKHLGMNFAKNTVKHLRQIVAILVDGGILAVGQLSLQSMDEETLRTIERSNIKFEKYEELSEEFRRAGLPLYVELMMGLPGATTASFRDDLQECISRELHPKVYPTQLLVNSPMNAPDYRARHGIEVRPGSLVTSAATFTRDDYDEMMALRRVFLLGEKFGVLRHISRYVRQETGRREIDLMAQLRLDVAADRHRWPVMALTFEAIPDLMVPPVSWRTFYDELRGYLLEVAGLADDSAFETAMTVQHALVPARQRSFPLELDLAHDFGAWHAAMIAAKHGRHFDDWMSLVPPLRELGPARFVIDDPHRICELGIGHSVESVLSQVAGWELVSPVARVVGSRDEMYE